MVAASLPGGSGAAVECAAAAISDHRALAGLADGLRRAAIALSANLSRDAVVIAAPAVRRIGLAVGTNITAARQTFSATFACRLATVLLGAARPPAADVPFCVAACRATTGIPARAALPAAAGLPDRTTILVAADLAGSAHGPILPARRGRTGARRSTGASGSTCVSA